MKPETLTATLNSIRYQGRENFIIGNYSVSKNGKHLNFFGLGCIVNPQVGVDYELLGRWDDHRQYGKQFKFNNYKVIKPTNMDGIFRYLVRVAKWIGPTTAERLINLYGDQALEVLRNDPEMVSVEIPGITIHRAEYIQKELIKKEKIESTLVELMSILRIPGIPRSLPMAMINKYGPGAAEELKKNPYVIIELKGVGFSIADGLAINVLKISPKSQFRICAAISHGLKAGLNETGSTWLKTSDLIEFVYELISIDTSTIKIMMQTMICKEQIVEGAAGVTFPYINNDEDLIAAKIGRIIT